jgi:2-dehydro-3-deoxygluconokinase
VQRALRIEDLDGGYTDIDPVRPTGLYLREWLPDGARRVTYYRRGSAASALGCGSEPRLPAVGPYDVALLTGITLALGDGPRRACRTLAGAARAAGARIAFDPNYRPALWASEHAARDELIGFIGLVDVLLLSEDDAALLYGSTEPDLVLASALAHGPRVVVYKRGERGAAIATSMGDRFDEPAAPVRLALDPVGAGDGFNGGFVAGLLGGLGLAAATTLGAYVGARAVEAVGDHEGYPRRAELPADLQAMFDTGPVGKNQLPTS